MATNVMPKNIDYNPDEIMKDPNRADAYVNFINKQKQDPLNSFAQNTIMAEINSPISQMKNGYKMLQDANNKLELTPDQIQQVFQPIELPQQYKDVLDKHPEKIKQMFNYYAYEPGDWKSKMPIRQLYSAARSYLISKGQDPDSFLQNHNVVTDGLNFVGNLLSVPSNLLAKGFNQITTGQSKQVPVWGGTGWEEAFREIGADPEIQSLIDKTHNNIPLTQDEHNKLHDFDVKYGVLGTIGNIVLDPTILVGGVAKGAESAVKGGAEGLKGIESGLKIFAHPIKTLIESRQLIKGGEEALVPEGKTLLKNIVDHIGEITKDTGMPHDLENSLKEVKSILYKPNETVKATEIGKGLDNINLAMKKRGIKNTFTIGKKEVNKFAKEVPIDNLINNYKEKINKIKDLGTNKPFKFINDKIDKFHTVLHNTSEKTGFRKAFQGDLPITQVKNVIGEDGKMIKQYQHGVNDARKSASKLRQGAEAEVKKDAFEMHKYIVNNVSKALKENSKVVEYLAKPENKGKTYNHILSDLIEAPKFAEKEYKLSNDMVQKFRDIQNKYILSEAKYSGDKIVPKFGDLKADFEKGIKATTAEEQRTQWKDLAKKYNDMFENYTAHPEFTETEGKLKDLLKNSNGMNFYDKSAVEGMTEDVAYLLHSLTPEAMKIVRDMDSSSRGLFGQVFSSFIRNKSKNTRLLKGTVNEINDAIKNGKLSNFIEDMALKEVDTSKAKAYEGMAKELKVFEKNGIPFFDNDIVKLISTRGNRMAKTLEQAKFRQEIIKFGDKIKPPESNWIKPNLKTAIPGYSDTYFHPEVAHAIEEMYNYIGTDKGLNIYLNVFQDLQNFWKAQTLSLYPVTALRNIAGNIFNVLLVDNPANYLKGMKDSWNMLHGIDYKILAGNNILKLNDIYDEAIKHNIMGTVFQDLNKEGKGLNTVNQFIRNLPPAKLNGFIEEFMKLSLFTSQLAKGKSYDEAAKVVDKVLFDYGDLTKFETNIRKYVIPFYTWSRKNIPLQIGNLLSNPSKAQIKIEQALNRQRPSDQKTDERFQSDYLAQSAKGKIGNKYMIFENTVPLFDIDRVLRSGTGIQGAVDEIMNDVSPFIKTPVENLTNYSFTTHKQIQKSPYETSEYLGLNMSPLTKNILSKFRTLSMINKGINIPTGQTTVSPDKDILSMLLALNIMSPVKYDMAFSKKITSGDYKHNVESELNTFKTFASKYKAIIQQGKKPTKKDAEYVKNRTSKIVSMINHGYDGALLDNKDRGKYYSQLINIWKQ